MLESPASSEAPAAIALRALSIFGPDQGGAYREHFSSIAQTLGKDVPTKMQQFIRQFSQSGRPGLVILTGNAGTGKTAICESYCSEASAILPKSDELQKVAVGKFVLKDLSGLPSSQKRKESLRNALLLANDQQVLICANEGVLRDALDGCEELSLLSANIEVALRHGAYSDSLKTIANLNRQRMTGDALWKKLIDFVSRPELWPGCSTCPKLFSGEQCPLIDNAHSLQNPNVQNALKFLVRIASGSVASTLREILSILAWAVVGTPQDESDTSSDNGLTCRYIRNRVRSRGPLAFDSKVAYYNNLLGAFLAVEAVERSPLLLEMQSISVGLIADLEVDSWLRDSGDSVELIQRIAGRPDPDNKTPYTSHLSLVATAYAPQTFEQFGATLSTSEDNVRVDACIDALRDPHNSPLIFWRRRVFFEGNESLGGIAGTAPRLSRLTFGTELIGIAQRVAASASETGKDLRAIVRGLNALTTGIASVGEGLIVPDSASLFSRAPASYEPPGATIVHGQVSLERLRLLCPDRGVVRTLLDVDDVEVRLVVDEAEHLQMTIGPRLFQALRQAETYHGPVTTGEAELSGLKRFYASLVPTVNRSLLTRIVKESATGATLVPIQLPAV